MYHGSSTTLAANPSWSYHAPGADTYLGFSLADIPDYTGTIEEYSGLAIGAPLMVNSNVTYGAVLIFHGALNAFPSSPTTTIWGTQSSAQFGYSIASGGSIDGDGYNDLIVGAPVWYNGQSGEGKAFAFDNSGSGVTSTIWWSVESDSAGAALGYSVACGKLDNDSYADVFVGAPYFDGGGSDRGTAIFYKSNGSTLIEDSSQAGLNNSDYTGMRVATGYVEGNVLGFIVSTPGDGGGTVAIWEYIP